MLIVALIILGLCFGSFVNALVWRIHEQENTKSKKKKKDLSLLSGRSMCVHCGHELAARDLIPLISWLSLRGKCRYCKQPIPIQYPLIEAMLPILFVSSYIVLPTNSLSSQIIFVSWLAILTGFLALFVYDLRWMLLPNRILFPLIVPSAIIALTNIFTSHDKPSALINLVLALFVSGGLFYILYQVSGGKWIGGGDVKLGWVIGGFLGTPGKSFLMLFLASLIGSAVSLAFIYTKKLQIKSIIPFGPFLILASVISMLFGSKIISFYLETILKF